MQWLITFWNGLVWVVLKLTGQSPQENPEEAASDPNPTNENLGRWIFHQMPPLNDGEDKITVLVDDKDVGERSIYVYERQKSGVWEETSMVKEKLV